MQSQTKSPSTVVKYSPACALAVAALTALIITAGCASPQPPTTTNQQAAPVQNGTAIAVAQPTVATHQQFALVLNGTEMVSPASGQSFTKSNKTPAVIYKNRLYFFCCQSHTRTFCTYPERFVNQVELPNGMDIRGAKPPTPGTAKPTPKSGPDPNKVYDIATDASPVRGADDAPITIVEFVDIQCPYCIREWPKLKQILEEYPQKVRVVFKHFPLSFHKKAKPVHSAMEFAFSEGGSDAFWKMHDMIVSNPTKVDPTDLKLYAESSTASAEHQQFS